MTIKDEEAAEEDNPSLSALMETPIMSWIETGEARTTPSLLLSAGGIDFGSSPGDIEEPPIPPVDGPPASLLELLQVPDFLLASARSGTGFAIPEGERCIVKIQFWLDVFQLLSMRQLVCRAHCREDIEGVQLGVNYAYTCAADGCCASLSLTRPAKSRYHGVVQSPLDITSSEVVHSPLEHTCSPHCRWSVAATTDCPETSKPQAFVLSPALRFAIVSEFVHRRAPYNAFALKEALLGRKGDTREDLRLQMNHELGLDVSKDQWRTALELYYVKFLAPLCLYDNLDWALNLPRIDRLDAVNDGGGCLCHYWTMKFLSPRIDRLNEVNDLSTLDYWMVFHNNKHLRSPGCFYVKIRNTDSACARRLKYVWLWTVFPVQVVVEVLIRTLLEFIALPCLLIITVSCFPCFLCDETRRLCYKTRRDAEYLQARLALKERYRQEGVDITGFVSDRDEHSVIITYFCEDGTMVNRCYSGVYGESVPMVVLPDKPFSGIPFLSQEFPSNYRISLQ